MFRGQKTLAPLVVSWSSSVLYFLHWGCLQSSFQAILAFENKAKSPAVFPLGCWLEEYGASFSSKGPSGRGGSDVSETRVGCVGCVTLGSYLIHVSIS